MNSAILETNKKKIVPQNYESGYQDESQLIPDTEIPPVLNINDYMGAKDAYEEEEHPLIKGSIADKMRGYWELEKFENYRDVDQEAEQKKRGDIERFFDNFYKNLEDPEVSAEIIKAYGKDFFESFKSASDEDKEKILGSRYLRAVYGDTDEALMMHRRALGVPIMKNDITDTTEGAWKQRTAQRGPIVKSAYDETKKYKEYLASSSKIQDKLDEYIYARIETGSTEEAMRKAGFDDKDREALSNVLWDNRMDLSIERAGRFVKAQELGPVDEGSVLERAKELFSNGRTVRFDESGKPLVLYQQHAGLTWEESLKKAADELRPKFTQKDITRFGQDLAKLKQSDPRAYEYVVGIYHKEANSIRNNGTAFFTPFYYMMGSMLESTLDFAKEGGKMSLLLGMRPVMAGDPLLDVGGGMESMYNEAQKNVKLITQEENDAISQIRELKKSISQSPDESPWYRYVADTLGTMAAQTLDFATTGGLVTFTSLTHDRTEQLMGEGNSGTEAITRGLFAGGTELVIERLGGQYFAKNMKWLGRKVPGAQRFVGYVGGASEAVKRGMYKSAGARFGVASLGAGLSEWAEEFAQPTLQTPLDSLTAWAFGSDNGMTWDDWADEMSGAADWKLGLSMAVFGGAFGAASLPGYSREAAIAKLNPNEIMAMWGVSESEAKRISRIANPVQKFKALEELPSYEMASKAKQLDNVRLGFKNMEDDHAWLVESEVYQAEVEAMSLPQVTKKGDDQWEFTSKVKTEDGFEEIKSTYSTKEATAVMQDLVTSQFAERMVEAKEMINKGRLINALEGSGKFVFEEMSEQETIESIRSLAKQAALLIDQGENTQNEASALGSKMTLAQIMDLEQSFSERAEQESGRDAGFNVEQAASSAYRIPMKNGQTLIRYYNKQASTLELMEEVIETHLTEDMRSKGFDLEYYHNQIAAVDEYLHQEGYMRDGDHLINQSGRTSQKVDVIEGISKLAKGDVLSRMDKMNLPEWLKDFLSWVRNVVGSAVALAKLGDGLAQLEALSKKGKSKVDIDFIEAVHALSNNLQGYFVQEGEMAMQGSIEMMAQSVKEGQEDAFVVAGESFSMVSLSDKSGNKLSRDTFITTPNGDIDWFAVPKRKGQEAMPVRLLVGEEKGNHKGYGLSHIIGSRDDDVVRLWDKVSPEKYLSGIVNNISEIYEVAPGRELLVKGKQPSSWLVIQISQSDGYYSIISAYPVGKHKKPQGRKIPFDRRLLSTPGKEATGVFGPKDKNPSGGLPSKGGVLDKASQETMTADRGYGINLNPSISVVNINDIVAKFDDGRSMDASYSMSMKVMEGMSSTTQRLELVSRMMRSLKAEVLTWDKFEGSTKQEEFLKAVGKNLSLVKTAAMGLPMEYRAKVKPFIDKIEVLTEVAVKGRVEDTKDMMNRIALKETKEDFAQIKEDTEEWADRLSQEMAKWAKHDHKVNQKGLRTEQKELRAEALRLTKQWESLVLMEKTGEVQNTKAGKELASEMEGEWHDGKTEDEAEFPYMEDVTREVKAWAKKKKAEAQKELKDLYQSSQETFKGFAFNKKMMLSQEVEKGMKAYAEEKVHEVMRDAFTEIAGKYEAFTKGVIDEKMEKMLKSALNLKKNGKRDKDKKRGKISYEAYAYLEDRVIPLLRMTAEEKKAEEDRLNARILELSANENNTAEQQVEMNEVSTDLLELGVYGCFEQMSADEAFKAYQSLHEYITTQKESWKEKAEAYTQRMRAISRQLVGDLNITGKVADENALREANEAFKNGKIQWAKIADYMESMHQFLDRLGSHKSKALQALSARLRNQLGEAEEAMTMSSMVKSTEVEALYEMILTKDVLSMRHVSSIKGWVEWFKQSHDTGISKKGIKAFSLEMGIKEIEELRGMSKSQLDQWISERWDAGEKYYSHAGVAALIENLNEYEVNLKSDQERKQRGEKQEKLPNGKYFRARKRLSAQGVDQGGNIESLKLSRDNALYIILQSEQDSYREMLRDQGWTPDVIKQLREFVGEEGVQIGYGLRDMFARQGNKLAEKYQDKYGMRFPRVENYYPARFSVYDVQDDSALSDMIAGIPTVGGGQNLGWQKQRTDHNRKIDTSVGALGVFFEATTLSDSWYYMDDFISEVKGLLKNRDVAESLVSNLGVNDYVRLRQWVELVERQGVVKGKSVGALDNLVNGIMSGSAKSILAFRVETLLKQGSAVLNAWVGDDTIGLTDYLLTMAKMRNNTSQMSIAKMLKSDVFQSRISSKLDIEALSKMGNDTTQSMAENMIMVGMGLIEGTDVLSNVFGATALWNIKYNQAIKSGLKSYMAEEEAWSAVRASLKKAAQPIGWSEKSFGGLKVNAFGRMMFFMMSENVNKSAIVWNLIQDALTGGSRGLSGKQRWNKLGKAGQIWLVYGAVQSLIGALLDYFTDDEDRRKDRDLSGYVYSALFGVINGFPLLGEGIEAMFGGNVYAGSSGRALINFQGGKREVMKLAKMMGDDNEYSAYEYTMQSIKLLRFFGAAGGAVSKGSSKVTQVIGQYMQAGVSVTNPITTINKVANSHLVEE